MMHLRIILAEAERAELLRPLVGGFQMSSDTHVQCGKPIPEPEAAGSMAPEHCCNRDQTSASLRSRKTLDESSLGHKLWNKLQPLLPKILPVVIGILLAIFAYVRSYTSSEGYAASRFMEAMRKKDFPAALTFAKQVGDRHKEPGLGEFLSAISLLELGRLEDALSEADAAVGKNARREHGLLRARILYRMGRESDGNAARDRARTLPFGKWSDTDFPEVIYPVAVANGVLSVQERLDVLRTNRDFESFRVLLGEASCLEVPFRNDQFASHIVRSLYLACLKKNDWESAHALVNAMPGKQRDMIVETPRISSTSHGAELAAWNLICWLPCMAKQKSLADVPRGNFTELRAVLLEVENAAGESQRNLRSMLAKFESSANATSGSTDPELVTFSETNIRLLEEFATSCRKFREWSYSSEVLKRRTDSGELVVEAIIRGYFGDAIGTLKEYQGSRDSGFMELSRITDELSDVERRRSNLYAAPNGALDKYLPKTIPN